MDKLDTNSKCTALEVKHTKTAMYIFNSRRPRIPNETLTGPQKSTPTIKSGHVALTRLVSKFPTIWDINLGL